MTEVPSADLGLGLGHPRATQASPKGHARETQGPIRAKGFVCNENPKTPGGEEEIAKVAGIARILKTMPAANSKRFSPNLLAAFAATKYMPIRAGDHRFIHIWVVVVQGRVVVRSWNDKPSGWYRAFLAQPLGHVRIDDRELPVRAVRVRSAGLNDGADDAFASKYTTKANAQYVKGFTIPKRKATTLELIPA